jgi:hypothetical protein
VANQGLAVVARRRQGPLWAHPPLPAQALGLLEGGLDVGNADIEEHVAVIARASADATRDPSPVAGRDAVHEAVVARLRHRLGDRGADVELPAEQFAEVTPQVCRILPDDLEVHHWLSMVTPFRAGRLAAMRHRSSNDDRRTG